METKLLNEYIFADLVERHAYDAWRKRLQTHKDSCDKSSGSKLQDILLPRISDEDVRAGVEYIERIRMQSLQVAQELNLSPETYKQEI